MSSIKCIVSGENIAFWQSLLINPNFKAFSLSNTWVLLLLALKTTF